ncbi:dockerin type I repeat-containing protein [Ruminococcus albus]|uniref:dockerin type I repeat-containing protein n=1 Tax=Ruminococcus albus TaxID=1264 RepID=UPI000466C537|nr:dockerin type I repeat-containing protein [Ruminococcus albus]
MARNLSKDLKRLVAGLCAVLIVGGAVPLQPLVNFGGTIKAAADDVQSQPVFINYTPEIISNNSYWFVRDDNTGLSGVGYKSNNYHVGYTTAQTTFKVYPINGQIVKVNWKISSEKYYDCMTITAGNSTPVSGTSGAKSGSFNITGTETSASDGITVTVKYSKDEAGNSNDDTAYVAFEIEQNKASLSPSGFVEGEDYAVVGNVTKVSPGDVVTIYSNKKFKTDKDYTTLDFEKNPDTEGDYEDFKYKCTMKVIDQATFGENEVISFIEEPKVDFEFVDLEDTDYVVVEQMDTPEDDGDNSVYVTEHADIFTKKRIDLDESIFENSTVRFVDCVKEIPEDGFFTVNNENYLYRYHVTFPNYPYPEGITATFTAEKNVDLEFENMAENKKFAVEGDLPYAYVADGSVIYSDQTLAGNISQVQLQESTTSGGYEYKGETYKYKYDVTYSGDLKTGDTVTFSHVHEYGNPHVDIEEKPDIIIADCTGENGKEVGTVEIAQLKPKDIYYYGDLPTVEEVVVKPEQMPKGITSIDPVSLSIKKKGKTSSQDYFTDFGTYELSTIVNVVCGGKTYPISITKDVEYSPRSLFGAEDSSSADEEYTGCYFYLRRYEEAEVPQEEEPAAEQGSTPEIQEENPAAEEQGEPAEQQELQYEDTLLTVKNGVITLPDDSFVYNKREQKPVIVVKNSINGTVTELTEEEITSTVEGKTGANKDNEYYEFKISAIESEDPETDPAKYTGEVTVKWRIEKAPNNVTFVPKTDTVYDAEVLDDTDFTFTDPDDTLNDSNIKVEFEGSKKGYEFIAPDDAETPYQLTEADDGKMLTTTLGAVYKLPENVAGRVVHYYVNEGKVETKSTGLLPDTTLIKFAKHNMSEEVMMDYCLDEYYPLGGEPIEGLRVKVTFEDNELIFHIFSDETYETATLFPGEEYDITSAGVQKGTITIKSDNYQDKVMDFETTIAKKEVTVAPNGIKDNEKNTITWGELIKDSDVLYTQDGVVDKDKPAGGDYNFGLIFTAEGYNFEDASKNNVGEYKLVPSDIFAEYNAADNNYLLVLPKEETEEEVEEVIPVEVAPLELSEVAEQEEQTEQEEEVKLDTLTIVPYELTSSNVTVADITYQYDTYVKTPTVTASVPYSVKDEAELQTYTLTLGTVEDHDSKDAFVKGVRYDNIVGEKNISVATDDTTNKNFTTDEDGVEFKWYIRNGTMTVDVGNINGKIYDGTTVTDPTVTVKNQINEAVQNADIKVQYQKKDEGTGGYSDPVDEAPKDAGTYRAVVTTNADSYNEKVSYSDDFTIDKRTVKVTLNGLPTVKGYNDKTVEYKISKADAENPNDFTGIIDNEVEPEGTVVIEAGKLNGNHITNDDLPEIVEALGDNYTFRCDEVLSLAEPKLARLEVRKAYMDDGEVIKPHDYITAYDENGRDITDKCVVINIDNINQTGDYKIEVNDGSLDVPLSDILYVLTKVDKVNDLIAELPESEDVTAEDEDAITNAREAYEALTDEQKAKVDADALNKLEDAEEALEDAKKAAAATEAINALPDAEDVTTEDAEDIENARDKYDALTDAQKDLIDEETVDKLEAAETALAAAIEAAEKAAADQTAADAVKQEINNLPAAEDVTTEDSKNIVKARADYDALTDAQKALVDEETVDKLEAAETALAAAIEEAEKAAADEAAADAVKQEINNLPAAEDVTTEDSKNIENARDKYDALTDAQKALVDEETVDKLEAAETALAAAIEEAEKAAADQTAADAVKQEINNLPAAEDVTTEDAEDIENARDKYDALTDAQKDLIDEETVDKLEAAETALAAAIEEAEKAAADEAAANAVRDSINALPETEAVKPEDAEKIAKARDDYNALTAAQKELVDEATLQKLEAAEDALEKANEAAKKAAENEAAADAVKKAINDLPAAENVTVDDADAIAAVREAFEALTDDQKGMVDGDTMKKLDDAEAALDTAKKAAEKAAEDQAAADAVKNAINALPAAEDLTKDDAEAIANARKLFDELTDEQKALIDPEVVKKLTDNETAVAAIIEESKYMKGDVNGDGKININDLTKIAAHVKGKKLLTEEEQMRADVNGDGKLDINDISKIAAHIKGKRLLK